MSADVLLTGMIQEGKEDADELKIIRALHDDTIHGHRVKGVFIPRETTIVEKHVEGIIDLYRPKIIYLIGKSPRIDWDSFRVIHDVLNVSYKDKPLIICEIERENDEFMREAVRSMPRGQFRVSNEKGDEVLESAYKFLLQRSNDGELFEPGLLYIPEKFNRTHADDVRRFIEELTIARAEIDLTQPFESHR